MNYPPASTTSPRRYLAAWVIGGLIALAGLLLIGAVGVFFYFGINLFNEQARAAIRADPAVTAAVGTIADIEFDFTATGHAPGAEDFAYRVSGDRASGLLVGRFVTVDADTEELRSGILTLEDGRVIRIGTSQAQPGDPSRDESAVEESTAGPDRSQD